jgi:ParB-like chromosome segregation protein Spo0J
MAALKISYKDPAGLRPRTRNPRTHTAKQIKQIAASIKEFGFNSPILIDGSDGIIAGHGRADAAKLIGMSDVPTVRVDHLSPAQIRAYVIADNRLAENAGWERWSRFPEQNGGLAKVDSGLDYAANFSTPACVA